MVDAIPFFLTAVVLCAAFSVALFLFFPEHDLKEGKHRR